jgi:alkanesulfonate monooxygenase SsuD/methylene tetrahydromethanopterin reductase-like flavin-dependent oxidoreductase (luciferase family)
MARQSHRMSPSIIAEDEEAFAALKAIANYAPSNTAFTLAAIEHAYQELQGARTGEVQADAAAKAASDKVVEKQSNFHDLIIGSKDQVTAQFGRNSDEAQSVGRKKPSERKAPRHKSKKGSGENQGS